MPCGPRLTGSPLAEPPVTQPQARHDRSRIADSGRALGQRLLPAVWHEVQVGLGADSDAASPRRDIMKQRKQRGSCRRCRNHRLRSPGMLPDADVEPVPRRQEIIRWNTTCKSPPHIPRFRLQQTWVGAACIDRDSLSDWR